MGWLESNPNHGLVFGLKTTYKLKSWIGLLEAQHLGASLLFSPPSFKMVDKLSSKSTIDKINHDKHDDSALHMQKMQDQLQEILL